MIRASLLSGRLDHRAPPRFVPWRSSTSSSSNRRSLYTGSAIGYLSRGGTSDFNIAIRTILVEGDRASFQVGGGIVADSDPEAEYEETLAKGQGMRAALTHGAGGVKRRRKWIEDS